MLEGLQTADEVYWINGTHCQVTIPVTLSQVLQYLLFPNSFKQADPKNINLLFKKKKKEKGSC